MRKGRKTEKPAPTRAKVKGIRAPEATAPTAPVAAPDGMGFRAQCFFIVSLAVLALIPYAQVHGFGFVSYDDGAYITENPRINAGLTGENIAWALTTGAVSNWHPLTWLSYLLDAQLFGAKNAGAFHMENALFHAINAALLFLLLYRMTRGSWPSAFVAALFAVHPLHVESVAWIAERKDVLSMFFWLLTMLAYVRYVASPGPRYLLVVVSFALGLMAKPMLVTLPAVLLLMDYWPLQRLDGAGPTRARWQWLLIEKLPLFAMAAVSSVITVVVQQKGHAVVGLETWPAWLRVANAAVAYARYILMTVMPVGLIPFYPHPGHSLPPWQIAVAVPFLAGVSFLVAWQRTKRPYLLIGWLWYLGTLVPVIGIVQVGGQALADRYSYIPLVGLFIMAAWGIKGLAVRYRIPKMALGVGGAAVLCVLTIATGIQASYWRDSTALFEHALKVSPANYLAHDCLGIALAKQGRLDEAKEHFLKELEIKPDSETHNNLGHVLLQQKYFDDAKAHFLKALELQPSSIKAHILLAETLANQGHLDDAKAQLSKTIELQPDSLEAHQGLGLILRDQGHLDEAKAQFRKVIQLSPGSAEAQHDAEAIKKLGATK